MQQRIGTITRNTKETQITLTINLDGSGKADISTWCLIPKIKSMMKGKMLYG